MLRRVLVALPLAAGAVLVAAPAAYADHVHGRVLGNGNCVLLAPEGGEKYVQLPQAEEYPENRRHPLHTNVHLGRPGSGDRIFVAGDEDGPWTGCPEGTFVNR